MVTAVIIHASFEKVKSFREKSTEFIQMTKEIFIPTGHSRWEQRPLLSYL